MWLQVLCVGFSSHQFKVGFAEAQAVQLLVHHHPWAPLSYYPIISQRFV